MVRTVPIAMMMGTQILSPALTATTAMNLMTMGSVFQSMKLVDKELTLIHGLKAVSLVVKIIVLLAIKLVIATMKKKTTN